MAKNTALEALIAATGKNGTEFAEASNIKIGTLRNYLAGKRKNPGMLEVKFMADAAGVSYETMRAAIVGEVAASSEQEHAQPTAPDVPASMTLFGEDDSEEERGFRSRLHSSSAVDASLIELLAAQANSIRALDRRLGSRAVYEQLVGYMESLERLYRFNVEPNQRKSLAKLYADGAALAGWQALDLGKLEASWDWFERSKSLATDSGDFSSVVHGTAEQAYVLLEVGDVARARQLVDSAMAFRDRIPEAVLAWTLAVDGEVHAESGDRRRCNRSFDDAERLIGDGSTDQPFLFLQGSHLQRWRGSALVKVGDAKAIAELESSLEKLDTSFVRARAGMLLDLADALISAGKSDSAMRQVRDGWELAVQLGSVRQQKRARRLKAKICA